MRVRGVRVRCFSDPVGQGMSGPGAERRAERKGKDTGEKKKKGIKKQMSE